MKPEIKRKTETTGFLVTPRFEIEVETYLTKCPYFADLIVRGVGDDDVLEFTELRKEELELIRDTLSHTIERMVTTEKKDEQ